MILIGIRQIRDDYTISVKRRGRRGGAYYFKSHEEARGDGWLLIIAIIVVTKP